MLELTQTSHFGLYFLLVAGIVILPGMDMAFVLASALADGRRAGLVAMAGLVVGGMIHVAMSALGIGLLLIAAPRLFNVLLVAGALYIAWIGVALWRAAQALAEADTGAPSRPFPAVFSRAVATCLLNPKAYVFMLAVFPQFMRPEYGSVVAQSLVLALITASTQAVVYGAVALAAARVRSLLHANARAQQRLGQSVGALLSGAAAWTLWQGWRG
jgi:threonine/homoserine/homoserine lactone efflux protein